MPSLKAAQPMEKRALKTRSRTGASPIIKLVGLFKVPSETMDRGSSGSIQAQAKRLGDEWFSKVQRQDMVSRLGQLLGNRHLQRVINALPESEQTTKAYPPETPTRIQLMTIAKGAGPSAIWQEVPKKHRGRVRAAINIIDDMVANSTRLKNYFKQNAPGGTDNTLQDVYDRANVWELKTEGDLGRRNADNIAYDPYIYRIGKWQIASTLLHEMGHMAKFPKEEICEETLEAARAYCPFIESVTPRQARVGDEITIKGMSFGPKQTETDKIEFNGVDAGSATSWVWTHAGGEIKVRVPAGATSGPVAIINNNIRSNGVNFTVLS